MTWPDQYDDSVMKDPNRFGLWDPQQGDRWQLWLRPKTLKFAELQQWRREQTSTIGQLTHVASYSIVEMSESSTMMTTPIR
jgi:hypothetical protein